MLCSTIIPTVNRPSLERAVKSALEQGLGPDEHEIVVVNDSGSPLPVYSWVDSSQIKIVNTNHCERSVACNVGCALAKGKYLKILHDDDYLLPGALIALIQAAESFGSAWTYGALNRVDNDDNIISLNKPEEKGDLFALLVAGEGFHPSASLIERKAFFEVGGFDPLLKVREDYDLQCRVAYIGNYGYTPQVVAHVRIGHQGSTTMWDRVANEHRIVREKALTYPLTAHRLRKSIGGNTFFRGRICRAYLASAWINLRNKRITTAVSRLGSIISLSGYHFVSPSFWKGLRYRDYWHNVVKEEEDAFFSKP